MTDWTRVSCEVADAIRSAQCVQPTASKTDIGGTYGTPEIYTEWSAIYPSGREVPVLREHRWPGDEGEPDAKPCEHYVPRRHPMSTRIDHGETSVRCWRTDHNQARLINRRRALADEKHGAQSIETIAHDDPRWPTILMEEVGEVAHALTYDSGASPRDLADEILDVMAVCGAWLDALRVAGIRPDDRGVWLA